MASLCRCCARWHSDWARPLALVHFDAHVDTWPDNFGQAYAHGSLFYHAIKEGLVDPHRMIQIGIRSPVQTRRDGLDDWRRASRCCRRRTCMHRRTAAVAARIARRRGRRAGLSQLRHRRARPGLRARHRHAGDRRSRVVAGPGDPAPAARALRFVGMDVVEVAPPYDVAEITALAAATVVWEYLALLGAASYALSGLTALQKRITRRRPWPLYARSSPPDPAGGGDASHVPRARWKPWGTATT